MAGTRTSGDATAERWNLPPRVETIASFLNLLQKDKSVFVSGLVKIAYRCLHELPRSMFGSMMVDAYTSHVDSVTHTQRKVR